MLTAIKAEGSIDCMSAAKRIAKVAAMRGKGDVHPALQSVLVELSGDSATFTASDLNQALRVRVAAEVEVPGRFLIPGAPLADLVKRIYGPATIRWEGNHVRFDWEDGWANLPITDLDGWAEVPWSDAPGVRLPAPVLAQGIQRTWYAAADEDPANPVMEGVQLKVDRRGITLVGSDRGTIARARYVIGSMPHIGQRSVVVPARALRTLADLMPTDDDADVYLSSDERCITVTWDDTTYWSRVLDGEYPDLLDLLPAEWFSRRTVGRDDLLDAVGRVNVVASQTGRPLTLRWDAALLVECGEDAREALSTPEEGIYVDADVSPERVIQALKHLPEGTAIKVEAIAENMPLRLWFSDDLWTVVLPMVRS